MRTNRLYCRPLCQVIVVYGYPPSQAFVYKGFVKGALYVVYNRVVTQHPPDVKPGKFIMVNTIYHRIILSFFNLSEVVYDCHSGCVLGSLGSYIRVIDVYVVGEVGKSIVYVSHFRIAYISAVLLEGEAEQQYLGVFHRYALFLHQMTHAAGHILADVVVDLT